MELRRIACFAPLLAALVATGCASMQSVSHDAHLRSTKDTVVRGHLPAGRKPVLTISSGQVVRIDTVSHQGITRMDPVKFFGQAGIPASEVLRFRDRAFDIYFQHAPYLEMVRRKFGESTVLGQYS